MNNLVFLISVSLLAGSVFGVQETEATVCSSLKQIFVNGGYDHVVLIGTVESSEIIELDPPVRSIDNVFYSKRVTEYKIDEQIYGDRAFELDNYTIEQYWASPTEPYESGTQRVIPLYYYDYNPAESHWIHLNCIADLDMEYVDYINWIKDLQQDRYFKFDYKQHSFDEYLKTQKPSIDQESFTEHPSEKSVIPAWIKNNAGWWAAGQIDDMPFLQSIRFLILQGIIKDSSTLQFRILNEIPEWVKNNAGWWVDGSISEDEFISGIQYLVGKGIIRV